MTKIDVVALIRADFLFTAIIGPDLALLPSPPWHLSDCLRKLTTTLLTLKREVACSSETSVPA
jgi:hypothetical protein